MNIEDPKHYRFYFEKPLTEQEIAEKTVRLKLDPYRIARVYNLGGGAREQIVKKGLRWTTKGADERQVIKEIMQACARQLEMLNEEGTSKPLSKPKPKPHSIPIPSFLRAAKILREANSSKAPLGGRRSGDKK